MFFRRIANPCIDFVKHFQSAVSFSRLACFWDNLFPKKAILITEWNLQMPGFIQSEKWLLHEIIFVHTGRRAQHWYQSSTIQIRCVCWLDATFTSTLTGPAFSPQLLKRRIYPFFMQELKKKNVCKKKLYYWSFMDLHMYAFWSHNTDR
jgi:hypothetical protein